jgi:hypothetical protein
LIDANGGKPLMPFRDTESCDYRVACFDFMQPATIRASPSVIDEPFHIDRVNEEFVLWNNLQKSPNGK